MDCMDRIQIHSHFPKQPSLGTLGELQLDVSMCNAQNDISTRKMTFLQLGIIYF